MLLRPVHMSKQQEQLQHMMMELVLGKKPDSKSSIRERAQSRDKGKDNNKVALTVANKTATRSHMKFDDEKTATMFIT